MWTAESKRPAWYLLELSLKALLGKQSGEGQYYHRLLWEHWACGAARGTDSCFPFHSHYTLIKHDTSPRVVILLNVKQGNVYFTFPRTHFLTTFWTGLNQHTKRLCAFQTSTQTLLYILTPRSIVYRSERRTGYWHRLVTGNWSGCCWRERSAHYGKVERI